MGESEKIEKTPRIYVETSVVSGMFDNNTHPVKARPFWDAVRKGEIIIIVSDVLDDELQDAPQHIRSFFADLPASQIERIVSTKESDALAARYVAEGVVSRKSFNDCRHIALATIAEADLIVSWNCRHIVRRGNKYNGVNKKAGYPRIEIQTPNRYKVIYDI